VSGIRQDVGHEPSGAAVQIAAMVRTAHKRGSHYTPREIAAILRERADQIERGENED
jgi:hypothetical protein